MHFSSIGTWYAVLDTNDKLPCLERCNINLTKNYTKLQKMIPKVKPKKCLCQKRWTGKKWVCINLWQVRWPKANAYSSSTIVYFVKMHEYISTSSTICCSHALHLLVMNPAMLSPFLAYITYDSCSFLPPPLARYHLLSLFPAFALLFLPSLCLYDLVQLTYIHTFLTYHNPLRISIAKNFSRSVSLLSSN